MLDVKLSGKWKFIRFDHDIVMMTIRKTLQSLAAGFGASGGSRNLTLLGQRDYNLGVAQFGIPFPASCFW